MNKKQKILFLTIFPDSQNNSHSGVNDFLFKAILSSYPESVYGFPENLNKSVLHSLYNKFSKYFNLKRFLPIHEYKSVLKCCRELQNLYDKVHPDIIITTTPLCLTFLNFTCPTIVYTDAVIPSMLDYYPQFTNIRENSAINAAKLESIGLEKATHVFFASKWAAESALKIYQIPTEKITVIPRPRNITSSDKVKDIFGMIQQRFKSYEKHFLFVGVDWVRKGGDLANKIICELAKNHNVILDVVGVTSKSIPKSKFIRTHGFLNKSNNVEFEKLKSLYRDSFAFILPTQAEAMGISYNEAASYGLPLIANNTGGVSTIVNHDNGIFINELGLQQSLMRIEELICDYSLYQNKSLSAYATAEALPTWEEAVNIMIGKI